MVAIFGMRAVGVEIAKHMLLNGIENLLIYEQHTVTKNDPYSNFFLDIENNGSNFSYGTSIA